MLDYWICPNRISKSGLHMAKKINIPDEYLPMIQKMLDDNERAAKAVVDGAQQEYDKVLAERAAAKERLEKVKADSKIHSEAFRLKAIEKLKKEIEDKEREELAAHLLEKGLRIGEVAGLLGLPETAVEELAETLRIQTIIGSMTMRISYEDQGRGGYINIHFGEATHRWWWEFGGGNALVIIDIPTDENWEAQTGIPLERRMHTLEMIAHRVILDKAPGHQFRIDVNAIVVLS